MRLLFGLIVCLSCYTTPHLSAQTDAWADVAQTTIHEEAQTSILNLPPLGSALPDYDPIRWGGQGTNLTATTVLQPLPETSLTPGGWKPNPKLALLWAILPGGGQIYNRKYWKAPIVWGAMMACFYAINWNQRLYSDYHAAYRDLKSEHPEQNTAWLAFAPKGTRPEDHAQMGALTNTLKRGNDFYRRYRDLSIVLGVLVYGLSMLDAYVDAELYTFDISPDLSMRLSPTFAPTIPGGQIDAPGAYQVGLACHFTF